MSVALTESGSLSRVKRFFRLMRRRLKSWFLDLFLLTPRFERIRIEDEVIADICSLAKGSFPKEMVAFLTGKVRKESGYGVLVIEGLYLKAYQADENSTYFTLYDIPLSTVYGTIHSHPGFSNRPSLADKRLFNKEGLFHLIICRPYTRAAIAVYNKYGERIESVEF